MSLQARARFSTAAESYKKLGEFYEEESQFSEAILEYKRAIEVYTMDRTNSKISVSHISLKVADLMILSEHQDAYDEARNVNLFNSVVRKSCNGLSIK